MCISDNGVGIFRKIQAALKLLDERHAVLELAKGKFTTDPKNHSGEDQELFLRRALETVAFDLYLASIIGKGDMPAVWFADHHF